MNTNPLTMKLQVDRELAPCESPSERILEVTLEAPRAAGSFQRPPLNLGLVIDRSGSMSGEKLESVKQAASHVAGLLAKDDRASLVVYDHNVDVLLPASPLDMETRPALLQAIRSIRSGGSTNLSGGWLTGCNEVAKGIDQKRFSTALLLTDGLANVGITRPDELAMHARELARRGVSTSTIGVGLDFDQHLLEGMATAGEGCYRFIENPVNIPAIFEDIFKEMLSICARDIELTITFPPQVGAVAAGDWKQEQAKPGMLRVSLGALSAGSLRGIFVRLAIPAGARDTLLPVKVSLLAKGENGALIEASGEVTLRLTDQGAAEAAPQDKELMERYANVDMADQASEALKLEKQGKRQEASELLTRILGTHREHLDPERQQRYRGLSQRMAQGMDEWDRKMTHRDEYADRKRFLNAHTYDLIPDVKGHLIFDLGGKLVLLDTGSHVSFGNTPSITMMDRQVDLLPNYLGLTVDYLSQKIGVPLTALVGMDVLKTVHFQVDIQRRKVRFSDLELPSGRMRIPLATLMDVPYATIPMNGVPRKVFVDTGAKLHYLTADALKGLNAVDREMDFYPYPGMDEFETEVFRLPLEVAGSRHLMRCGVLPPLLEMGLKALGVEGLLGTELFDFYTVTFERGTRFLYLEPNLR